MVKHTRKKRNEEKSETSQQKLDEWVCQTRTTRSSQSALSEQVKEEIVKQSLNTVSPFKKERAQKNDANKDDRKTKTRCRAKVEKTYTTPLNITTKKVGNSTKELSKISNRVKGKKTVNSSSSDELPTFREKMPRKSSKQTETFKKYGVIVPSIDQIIAEQKHLSNYKIQVEKAQTLKEPTFKMPSTSRKNVKAEEQLMDCKHLSLEDISGHFKNNIRFLSNIMMGEQLSDRHKRYHDKKNLRYNLTDKDLTYSTSTIVFSFEQLDYMVSLMQEQFDPEDKNTCYFFKVLIPELCLKIFMETFQMNKRQANAYLNNRPV